MKNESPGWACSGPRGPSGEPCSYCLQRASILCGRHTAEESDSQQVPGCPKRMEEGGGGGR